MKVYYAHCLAIYNTPQEKRDVSLLESLGFEVVNPNSEECSEGYKREKMDFFKRFSKECDLIAFRATPHGRIPAGIAKEIEMFEQEQKPVIELPSQRVRRVMSVEETREYLREIGQR